MFSFLTKKDVRIVAKDLMRAATPPLFETLIPSQSILRVTLFRDSGTYSNPPSIILEIQLSNKLMTVENIIIVLSYLQINDTQQKEDNICVEYNPPSPLSINLII